MLNVLRQQASSWVVKALLLLLVVSFAIWGIGDVFFGGGQSSTVAKVGGAEIKTQELDEAFKRALDTVQQQIGTTLDREQAIGLGLMQRSLQELVAQRLIDQEAHTLGLAVADDTLRQMVVDNELFQTNGTFDRTRMEQLLRANGLTEQSYVAGLRQDFLRTSLTSSVTQPVKTPSFLVDRLYRYQNEQRTGRYATVRTAAITNVPAPTDADLKTLYEGNLKRFAVPEFRTVSFVALTPDALIPEFMPDEAAIRQAYDERQAQFRTPERRTIEQLLAKDQATIEQAAKLVNEGKSFADVAKAMTAAGVTADTLGSVTKQDLPLGLGDAAFAPAVNALSAPVESPFGWHLFRATANQPEVVTPFETAKVELGRELALEQAHDKLPDFANRLDDELAAGSSVKDAANAVGLAVKTLPAVNRQGQDAAGQQPAELPAWPEFLTTAFGASVNQPSLLEETQDGNYFVLQVDQITPERQKSLDEVKAEVTELWQAEQRDRLAKEQATALRAEIAKGRSLGVVARDRRLVVDAVQPVKRGGAPADQNVPPALVQALFATAPGQLAEQPVPVQDGYAVVQTDQVIPADPATDQAGVTALQQQLDDGQRQDLLSQYQLALQQAHPVEIDNAALNRLISNELDLPAGPPTLPSDY